MISEICLNSLSDISKKGQNVRLDGLHHGIVGIGELSLGNIPNEISYQYLSIQVYSLVPITERAQPHNAGKACKS